MTSSKNDESNFLSENVRRKNYSPDSSRPSLLGSAAAGLKNLVEISIDRIGIGRIACRHSTRNGH